MISSFFSVRGLNYLEYKAISFSEKHLSDAVPDKNKKEINIIDIRHF